MCVAFSYVLRYRRNILESSLIFTPNTGNASSVSTDVSDQLPHLQQFPNGSGLEPQQSGRICWLSLQCPQTPKPNLAWPCPLWAQNGQHHSRLDTPVPVQPQASEGGDYMQDLGSIEGIMQEWQSQYKMAKMKKK